MSEVKEKFGVRFLIDRLLPDGVEVSVWTITDGKEKQVAMRMYLEKGWTLDVLWDLLFPEMTEGVCIFLRDDEQDTPAACPYCRRFHSEQD